MKIGHLKSEYYEASGKLSDVVRQLNFAGIGVIWIFTVGKESAGIQFSPFLLVPFTLFILSLAFDLGHYAYKSAMLGYWQNRHWSKHKNEDVEVKHSEYWNWPTLGLFWGKTVLVIIAYLTLTFYIISQLVINYLREP